MRVCIHGYSTGTAQAVLDYARPRARLVFSCGWHITRDGQDVYSWKIKALVKVAGPLARLARFADLDDQVEACRRCSQATRGGLSSARVDFALFMVEAIENDEIVHEAPAIVGCQTPWRPCFRLRCGVEGSPVRTPTREGKSWAKVCPADYDQENEKAPFPGLFSSGGRI